MVDGVRRGRNGNRDGGGAGWCSRAGTGRGREAGAAGAAATFDREAADAGEEREGNGKR